LLLRETDRKIGLPKRVASCFTDARDPERIEPALDEMLAQRIYALALGYEDLNDHQELRRGHRVAIVTDAVRSLDPDKGRQILANLRSCSARLITTEETSALAGVSPKKLFPNQRAYRGGEIQNLSVRQRVKWRAGGGFQDSCFAANRLNRDTSSRRNLWGPFRKCEIIYASVRNAKSTPLARRLIYGQNQIERAVYATVIARDRLLGRSARHC
jgi:hypothetical protein